MLGFVEVWDRSASSCPKSSMVPTSLLRSRALGTPEFSFRPNRSPGRPLCTWASGFQQRNGFFTTINFWSKSSATPPCKNHKQKVGSSLSHQVHLWTPQQVQSSGCMYGNGLGKEPWGVCAPPLLTQLAFGGRGMGESRDASDAPEFKEDVPRRAFRHQRAS